jgi:hypothetical protein
MNIEDLIIGYYTELKKINKNLEKLNETISRFREPEKRKSHWEKFNDATEALENRLARRL